MSEILISFHRHKGQMARVLERYGIGSLDKYGRGIWVNRDDLPAIEAAMEAYPTRIVHGERIFVQGSNKHNHVELADFRRMFK